MDYRSKFVKQWYLRSLDSIDEFERFIFLYISMVVMIKGWAANNPSILEKPHRKLEKNHSNFDEGIDEGTLVNYYFLDNSEDIVAICEAIPSFNILVQRKTFDFNYILNSHKNEDQKLFKELAMFYIFDGYQMSVRNRSKVVGKIFKMIRNNLFHGGKSYDHSKDKEIVECSTPILEKLLINGSKKHLDLDLDLHLI